MFNYNSGQLECVQGQVIGILECESYYFIAILFSILVFFKMLSSLTIRGHQAGKQTITDSGAEE